MHSKYHKTIMIDVSITYVPFHTKDLFQNINFLKTTAMALATRPVPTATTSYSSSMDRSRMDIFNPNDKL